MSFFLQDVLFAYPDFKINPAEKNLSSLGWAKNFLPKIPESVARVEDVWIAGSGKLVYLLSDAHTNPSGQKNLSKTLNLIFKKTPVQLIFGEGGVGNNSLSFLRPKAPLKRRKNIGRRYVDRGLLHGEEYLDLVSDRHFEIWGVERPSYYSESLALYREVAGKRDALLGYLKRIEQTAEALKPFVFNPALKLFDSLCHKWKKESVLFSEYLSGLLAFAETQGVDTRPFKNLAEWKKLDLKSMKRLKTADFLEEIKTLEKAVYEKLSLSADEKTMLRVSAQIDLWERLATLTLTPEEWQSLRDDSSTDKLAEAAGFLNLKIMNLQSHYERAIFLEPELQKVLKKCERFYELTEKRDSLFVRKALFTMKRKHQNRAVLITGGFHTPNLKAILRQKGISYISLTPRVFRETNQVRYEKILLGKNYPEKIPSPATFTLRTPYLAGQFIQGPIWEGARVYDRFKSEIGDNRSYGARLASEDDIVFSGLQFISKNFISIGLLSGASIISIWALGSSLEKKLAKRKMKSKRYSEIWWGLEHVRTIDDSKTDPLGRFEDWISHRLLRKSLSRAIALGLRLEKKLNDSQAAAEAVKRILSQIPPITRRMVLENGKIVFTSFPDPKGFQEGFFIRWVSAEKMVLLGGCIFLGLFSAVGLNWAIQVWSDLNQAGTFSFEVPKGRKVVTDYYPVPKTVESAFGKMIRCVVDPGIKIKRGDFVKIVFSTETENQLAGKNITVRFLQRSETQDHTVAVDSEDIFVKIPEKGFHGLPLVVFPPSGIVVSGIEVIAGELPKFSVMRIEIKRVVGRAWARLAQPLSKGEFPVSEGEEDNSLSLGNVDERESEAKKDLWAFFWAMAQDLKNKHGLSPTKAEIQAIVREREADAIGLINHLRLIRLEKSLLAIDLLMGFELYVNSLWSGTPDSGMCYWATEALKDAFIKSGFNADSFQILEFTSDMSINVMHVFLKLMAYEGAVVIDTAAGQFFPEVVRHIVVDDLEPYLARIQGAIERAPKFIYPIPQNRQDLWDRLSDFSKARARLKNESSAARLADIQTFPFDGGWALPLFQGQNFQINDEVHLVIGTVDEGDRTFWADNIATSKLVTGSWDKDGNITIDFGDEIEGARLVEPVEKSIARGPEGPRAGARMAPRRENPQFWLIQHRKGGFTDSEEWVLRDILTDFFMRRIVNAITEQDLNRKIAERLIPSSAFFLASLRLKPEGSFPMLAKLLFGTASLAYFTAVIVSLWLNIFPISYVEPILWGFILPMFLSAIFASSKAIEGILIKNRGKDEKKFRNGAVLVIQAELEKLGWLRTDVGHTDRWLKDILDFQDGRGARLAIDNLIAEDSAFGMFLKGIDVDLQVPRSEIKEGFWFYELSLSDEVRRVVDKRMIISYNLSRKPLPLKILFKEDVPILLMACGLDWEQLPKQIKDGLTRTVVEKALGKAKQKGWEGAVLQRKLDEAAAGLKRKTYALSCFTSPLSEFISKSITKKDLTDAIRAFELDQITHTPVFLENGLFETSEAALPDGRNFPIVLFKSTFGHRNPTTQLFLEEFKVNSADQALEIGTGPGVAAISAALASGSEGSVITATDVDGVSVQNALYNVRRFGLQGRISVVQADLFKFPENLGVSPGKRFTKIAMNMPIEGTPDDFYKALAGDHDGDVSPGSVFDEGGKLLDRLLKEAPDFLLPGGSLEVVYPETPSFLLKVYEKGWRVDAVRGVRRMAERSKGMLEKVKASFPQMELESRWKRYEYGYFVLRRGEAAGLKEEDRRYLIETYRRIMALEAKAYSEPPQLLSDEEKSELRTILETNENHSLFDRRVLHKIAALLCETLITTNHLSKDFLNGLFQADRSDNRHRQDPRDFTEWAARKLAETLSKIDAERPLRALEITSGQRTMKDSAGRDLPEGISWGTADLSQVANPEVPRLSFADQSFKIVAGINVLEVVDPVKRRGIIGEMRRLLNPEGVIIYFVDSMHNGWPDTLAQDFSDAGFGRVVYKPATQSLEGQNISVPGFFIVSLAPAAPARQSLSGGGLEDQHEGEKRLGARLPLVDEENKSLTPSFPSAAVFFNSYEDWKKENPDAKIVVIVRHGPSGSNLFKFVQTHDSFSPLIRQGLQVRKELAQFFKALSLKFERYISSDLERAYETLLPAALQAGKPIEILRRFRESIIGPIGGIPTRDSNRLFPGLLEKFCSNPEDYEVPGLYSGKKVKKALREFFHEFTQGDPQSALIATHGMTILLSLMEIFNIPSRKYSAVFEKLIGKGKSYPNAGITIVSYHPGEKKWKLLVYGDDSYLSAQARSHRETRMDRLMDLLRFYGLAITRLLFAPFRILGEENPIHDYYPSWRTFIRPSQSRLEKMAKRYPGLRGDQDASRGARLVEPVEKSIARGPEGPRAGARMAPRRENPQFWLIQHRKGGFTDSIVSLWLNIFPISYVEPILWWFILPVFLSAIFASSKAIEGILIKNRGKDEKKFRNGAVLVIQAELEKLGWLRTDVGHTDRWLKDILDSQDGRGARLAISDQDAEWLTNRIVKKIRKSRRVKICFVCRANAFRSATGYVLSMDRIKKLGLRNVQVTSGGLETHIQQRLNEPLDPSLRAILERKQVDKNVLDEFRSKRLDPKDLEGADLVIVAELSLLQDLLNQSKWKINPSCAVLFSQMHPNLKKYGPIMPDGNTVELSMTEFVNLIEQTIIERLFGQLSLRSKSARLAANKLETAPLVVSTVPIMSGGVSSKDFGPMNAVFSENFDPGWFDAREPEPIETPHRALGRKASRNILAVDGHRDLQEYEESLTLDQAAALLEARPENLAASMPGHAYENVGRLWFIFLNGWLWETRKEKLTLISLNQFARELKERIGFQRSVETLAAIAKNLKSIVGRITEENGKSPRLREAVKEPKALKILNEKEIFIERPLMRSPGNPVMIHLSTAWVLVRLFRKLIELEKDPTVEDLAKETGLKENTIRQAINDGRIRADFIPAALGERDHYRISRKDVERIKEKLAGNPVVEIPADWKTAGDLKKMLGYRSREGVYRRLEGKGSPIGRPYSNRRRYYAPHEYHFGMDNYAFYEKKTKNYERILLLERKVRRASRKDILAQKVHAAKSLAQVASILSEKEPLFRKIVQLLIDHLVSPDVLVEQACAIGLEIIGAKARKAAKADLALAQTLEDNNPFVRQASAEALGSVRTRRKEVVVALARRLDLSVEQNETVRREAARALLELGPTARAAETALVETLEKEPVASTRILAVRALGKIRSRRSATTEALKYNSMSDSDNRVKHAAAKALASARLAGESRGLRLKPLWPIDRRFVENERSALISILYRIRRQILREQGVDMKDVLEKQIALVGLAEDLVPAGHIRIQTLEESLLPSAILLLAVSGWAMKIVLDQSQWLGDFTNWDMAYVVGSAVLSVVSGALVALTLRGLPIQRFGDEPSKFEAEARKVVEGEAVARGIIKKAPSGGRLADPDKTGLDPKHAAVISPALRSRKRRRLTSLVDELVLSKVQGDLEKELIRGFENSDGAGFKFIRALAGCTTRRDTKKNITRPEILGSILKQDVPGREIIRALILKRTKEVRQTLQVPDERPLTDDESERFLSFEMEEIILAIAQFITATKEGAECFPILSDGKYFGQLFAMVRHPNMNPGNLIELILYRAFNGHWKQALTKESLEAFRIVLPAVKELRLNTEKQEGEDKPAWNIPLAERIGRRYFVPPQQVIITTEANWIYDAAQRAMEHLFQRNKEFIVEDLERSRRRGVSETDFSDSDARFLRCVLLGLGFGMDVVLGNYKKEDLRVISRGLVSFVNAFDEKELGLLKSDPGGVQKKKAVVSEISSRQFWHDFVLFNYSAFGGVASDDRLQELLAGLKAHLDALGVFHSLIQTLPVSDSGEASVFAVKAFRMILEEEKDTASKISEKVKTLAYGESRDSALKACDRLIHKIEGTINQMDQWEARPLEEIAQRRTLTELVGDIVTQVRARKGLHDERLSIQLEEAADSAAPFLVSNREAFAFFGSILENSAEGMYPATKVTVGFDAQGPAQAPLVTIHLEGIPLEQDLAEKISKILSGTESLSAGAEISTPGLFGGGKKIRDIASSAAAISRRLPGKITVYVNIIRSAKNAVEILIHFPTNPAARLAIASSARDEGRGGKETFGLRPKQGKGEGLGVRLAVSTQINLKSLSSIATSFLRNTDPFLSPLGVVTTSQPLVFRKSAIPWWRSSSVRNLNLGGGKRGKLVSLKSLNGVLKSGFDRFFGERGVALQNIFSAHPFQEPQDGRDGDTSAPKYRLAVAKGRVATNVMADVLKHANFSPLLLKYITDSVLGQIRHTAARLAQPLRGGKKDAEGAGFATFGLGNGTAASKAVYVKAAVDIGKILDNFLNHGVSFGKERWPAFRAQYRGPAFNLKVPGDPKDLVIHHQWIRPFTANGQGALRPFQLDSKVPAVERWERTFLIGLGQILKNACEGRSGRLQNPEAKNIIVKAYLRKKTNEIVVEVTDDGLGMIPGQDRGNGFPLVREIFEQQLGGRVEIKTRDRENFGKTLSGTTVKIFLPTKAVMVNPSPEPAPKRDVKPSEEPSLNHAETYETFRKRLLASAYGEFEKEFSVQSKTWTAPDDTEIHYEIGGNLTSEKAMVFLHGWRSNLTIWLNQIKPYQKDYKLIYIDLRGHGRSGHGPQNPRDLNSTIAADLDGILREEKTEEVSLFGHSLGGMVVMEFMRLQEEKPKRDPIQITHLGLIDTTPYLPESSFFIGRPWVKWLVGRIVLILLEGIRKIERYFAEVRASEYFQKKLSQARSRWSHFINLPYRLFRLAVERNLFNRFTNTVMFGADPHGLLDSLIALLHFDGRDVLRRIKRPTMIVESRNDRVIIQKMARGLFEAAGNLFFKFFTMENSGHYSYQSEKLVEAISEFMKDVQVSRPKSDGVVWVTLARPHVDNAISKSVLEELEVLFQRLRNDETIRVLVLTGSGDVFCAGRDLKERRRMSRREDWKKRGQKKQEVLKQLRDLSFPTVAWINGLAGGEGLELAKAARFRIALKSSVFKLPAAGSDEREITAETAQKLGLVDLVISEPSELDSAIEYLLRAARFAEVDAHENPARLRRDLRFKLRIYSWRSHHPAGPIPSRLQLGGMGKFEIVHAQFHSEDHQAGDDRAYRNQAIEPQISFSTILGTNGCHSCQGIVGVELDENLLARSGVVLHQYLWPLSWDPSRLDKRLTGLMPFAWTPVKDGWDREVYLNRKAQEILKLLSNLKSPGRKMAVFTYEERTHEDVVDISRKILALSKDPGLKLLFVSRPAHEEGLIVATQEGVGIQRRSEKDHRSGEASVLWSDLNSLLQDSWAEFIKMADLEKYSLLQRKKSGEGVINDRDVPEIFHELRNLIWVIVGSIENLQFRYSPLMRDLSDRLRKIFLEMKGLSMAIQAHNVDQIRFMLLRFHELFSEENVDELKKGIEPLVGQSPYSVDNLSRFKPTSRILRLYAAYWLNVEEHSPRSFSLNELLDLSCAGFTGRRDLLTQIEKHYDAGNISIKTYEVPFFQVMMNLIKNAFEATNPRTRKVIIRTSGPDAKGMVKIEVQDNGHGVAPENLDKIFEPGFTTKEKPVQYGRVKRGFGLSVVKKIVEQKLHGTIEVRSQPGVGTTMILSIPISLEVTPSPGGARLTAPHRPRSRAEAVEAAYRAFVRRAPKGFRKTMERSEYIAQDGKQMACITAGNAKSQDVIVCVHGWMGHSPLWSKQLPTLAKLGRTYKIMFVDLSGHGLSEAHSFLYRLFLTQSVRDDIVGMLKQQGAKRVSFIGHSEGGMLAAVICHYEDRKGKDRDFKVESLIIVNSTPNPRKTAPRILRNSFIWGFAGISAALIPKIPILSGILDRVGSDFSSSGVFERLRGWGRDLVKKVLFGNTSASFNRAVYLAAVTTSPTVILEHFGTIIAPFNIEDILPEIRARVLWIGSETDPLTDWEIVQTILVQVNNPHITLWTIPKSDHAAQSTRRFGKKLLSFYANEGGFSSSGARLARQEEAWPVTRLAAWELLRALKLEEMTKPENSLVRRIELPKERSILRQELADVSQFDLLYNKQGQLIALFPILQENKDILKTTPKYLDLSPYYTEVPQVDSPNASRKWKIFSEQWRKDQAGIRRHLKSLPHREVMKKVGGTQAPYVYIEFKDGFRRIVSFNPSLFQRLSFNPQPGSHQIILPIFPTVYSPISEVTGDRGYWSVIHQNDKRLDLRAGQRVLVPFCGSGIDAWLAWLKVKNKLWVLDINPIAVANTKAVAKIAGFEIEAVCADNIVDRKGRPVFSVKFDRILADMPSVARNWRRRQFVDFWDGDPHGIVLKRFARGIFKLLLPDGRVLVWNISDRTLEFYRKKTQTKISVESILKLAGLEVETLPSGHKDYRLYLISLPKGARLANLQDLPKILELGERVSEKISKRSFLDGRNYHADLALLKEYLALVIQDVRVNAQGRNILLLAQGIQGVLGSTRSQIRRTVEGRLKEIGGMVDTIYGFYVTAGEETRRHLQAAAMRLFSGIGTAEEISRSVIAECRSQLLANLQGYYWKREILKLGGEFDAHGLDFNPSVITSMLLTRPRAKIYHAIYQWIRKSGVSGKELVYPFSGGDISTALLVSDADIIWAYDETPFGFDVKEENIADISEFKQLYFLEKALTGINTAALLSNIGFAKFPILWEIQALGGTDVEVKKTEKPGIYEVSFNWSYDSTAASQSRRRSLFYVERAFHDTRELERALEKNHSGATFYLKKGELDLEASGVPMPVTICFGDAKPANPKAKVKRIGELVDPRDIGRGISKEAFSDRKMLNGFIFIQDPPPDQRPGARLARPIRHLFYPTGGTGLAKAPTRSPRAFNFKFENFLVGEAHANPSRSEGLLPVGRMVYKVYFRDEGRRVVAIPLSRNRGLKPVIVRDTKVRGKDARAVERIAGQFDESIRLALNVGESSSVEVPSIVSFDADYFRNIRGETFDWMASQMLESFRKVFPENTVLHVFDSGANSGRSLLVERILKNKSALEFKEGQLIDRLDEKDMKAVEDGRKRLANLLSMNGPDQTIHAIAGSRLVPMFQLRKGDLPAFKTLFQMARYALFADKQDMANFCEVWKQYTGLEISEQTLWNILTHKASWALLFRYALPPLMTVSKKVMEEYRALESLLAAA